MPDYVLVRDVSTNHKYPEIRSIVEANPDAYEVLDDDATDPSGNPVPAVFNVPNAAAAYDGKKADELKTELENRGLPTDGLKADLLARLVEDDTKENI